MEGILEAGTVVLALGASVTLLVQMLVMAGVAARPWQKVAAAFAAAAALTALLALSAGLLDVSNLYGLVAGAIVAAAAAVGIHATNTADSKEG